MEERSSSPPTAAAPRPAAAALLLLHSPSPPPPPFLVLLLPPPARPQANLSLPHFTGTEHEGLCQRFVQPPQVAQGTLRCPLARPRKAPLCSPQQGAQDQVQRSRHPRSQGRRGLFSGEEAGVVVVGGKRLLAASELAAHVFPPPLLSSPLLSPRLLIHRSPSPAAPTRASPARSFRTTARSG